MKDTLCKLMSKARDERLFRNEVAERVDRVVAPLSSSEMNGRFDPTLLTEENSEFEEFLPSCLASIHNKILTDWGYCAGRFVCAE